jgi:rSAM/selenodomain-associated transferase 2
VRLSVVIPALDEAGTIAATLRALQPLRARGHEVVVADGGSADATRELAAPLADRVIDAPRGRARQMNTGARVARGDALLFLHADTLLPDAADALVVEALSERDWGRFDVRFFDGPASLAVVAFCMNLRSRLSGIATGDQAIFATREAWLAAGGFPEVALMEDVRFSARMKRRSPPACLRARVLTSGRRWRERGLARTILLMWRLRLMHFLGADPDELARRYAGKA